MRCILQPINIAATISKFEEAQKRGLAILEEAHQGEAFAAAGVAEQLGSVRYAVGDYQGARDRAEARAIWEKLLGADHYHLPSTRFSAALPMTQADYAKAETMYQKALTMSKRALGLTICTSHTATIFAKLYCTNGEYAKGEALYQQSLAIHRQKAQ